MRSRSAISALSSARFAERLAAESKRGSAGMPGRPIDLAEAVQQPPGRARDVDVAVGRGEASHRHARRVVVARLRRNLVVDGPPGGLEVHHRDHRFQQGGLHPAAGPGPVPVMQGDQHADGEIETGGQIGHGNPGARRLGARQAGDAHQAAHPLGDLVDAAPVGVRAVLAEAGDRSVDQARVPGVHGVEVEAQAVLDRGAHVLDQHVGGVDQAHQHVAALRRLQVQGQRPLVAVQVLEVGAVPAVRGQARRRQAGRRLHPDDVGAPVGELADAGGARACDRQVDDADVVERKMRGHAGSPPDAAPEPGTTLLSSTRPVAATRRGMRDRHPAAAYRNGQIRPQADAARGPVNLACLV